MKLMFRSFPMSYYTRAYEQINVLLRSGRPAPLTDCQIISNRSNEIPSPDMVDPASVGNVGSGVLRVVCREGFDGGLPQTFLLEVYAGDELKTKVTNQRPHFEVTNVFGHPDSGDVKLYVFAENSRGTSEPFILRENFRHLKQASKHAVEGERAKCESRPGRQKRE